MLRTSRTTFTLAAMALALGCARDDTPPDDTPPDPPTSVDTLLQGLGGADALGGLSGFSASLRGEHLVTGEGVTFQEQPLGSTFEWTLDVDLSAGTRRLDVDRDLEFFPNQAGPEQGLQQFTYFISEQGAWVEGRDDNETPPDVVRRTMPSTMYGAHTKELSNLFPHGLIQYAAEAGTLWEGGRETVDGTEYLRVQMEAEPSPIDLLVDPESGSLYQLRLLESEYLRRDVDVVYTFSGWTGEGVRFPAQVTVEVEGESMGTFEVLDVAVDPQFDEGLFAPPADAVVEIESVAEVERGHAHSQLHLGFAAASVGLDSPALDVVGTPIDDGTGTDLGLWYLTGADTRHHSVVVEQEQGVVLFDAPVRPERGDGIVEWIDSTIGKPITHIVISHHHPDHAAGARSVVATGASAVVFEDTADYFAGVFSAPSTIVPDTLSSTSLESPVGLVSVPRDGFVDLPDATNPIRIYHVPTPHADDMVMPVVTHASGTSLAFTVDIWSPAPFNFSFPEWVMPLYERFSTYGIDTTSLMFAGGHGGVGSYADFEGFVQSLSG